MTTHRAVIPAFAGGAVLFAVLFLILVSLEPEEAGANMTVRNTGYGMKPSWRWFHDSEARFRLRYPVSWRIEDASRGVALRLAASKHRTGTVKAAFFLQYGGLQEVEDRLGLPLVFTNSHPARLVRKAENVPVGRASGLEVVYELQLDSERVPVVGRATIQHESPYGKAVIILWRGTQLAGQPWVIMVDNEGGRHLQVLEKIRKSVQWQGSSPSLSQPVSLLNCPSRGTHTC